MKHLKVEWKKRLFFVMLISVIISLLLYGLEFTSWAETINTEGYQHGEESENTQTPPWYLMLILPLIKVAVLITIPALIFSGVVKLVGLVRR